MVFLTQVNSIVFVQNMIRRINIATLFCRSLYLPEIYRVVTSSVSTSAACQFKREDRVFLKNEIHEARKKYEDTFGNLESFEARFARIKDDPEDILEYEKLKAAPGKSLQQYITEVKSLLGQNDYKAALKLLEVDMRNDRIINTLMVYRMLINYNAKLGNLQEAYRLFTDFKTRGGKVTKAMYTSMFNACANCKNSFLAIKKAEAVREYMNKNISNEINVTHYNVMIKAYGRHGDLPTCLKIMDEVLEKRNKVKSETYGFLIQACITDTNSGLRHAFMVWRKMLQNRTRPCIYDFNLMLRCIRDCSLGEVSLITDAIKQILEESKYFYKRKIKVEKIGFKENVTIRKIPSDGNYLLAPVKNESETKIQFKEDLINLGIIETNESSVENKVETTDNSLIVENQTDCLTNLENKVDSVEGCLDAVDEKTEDALSKSEFELPNLLALKPTVGSVVEFKEMTTPQHRFILVGGVDGILKTMTEFGVKPDIKTFTLILSLIPSTVEAEEKLISLVDSYNVQLDTGFYNVLLKRRIFRDDHHLIKDSLQQMHSRNLKPDILTFGILSLGCKTHELGIEFLENLHKHGFRLNCEIVGGLLGRAKSLRDMNYVLTILRAAKEDGVEMNPKILAQLSRIIKTEKRLKLLKNNFEPISDEDNVPDAKTEASQSSLL